MSTKATILCKATFHIYRDCNDPGFIYIADNDGNEIKLSEKEDNDMGFLESLKGILGDVDRC